MCLEVDGDRKGVTLRADGVGRPRGHFGHPSYRLFNMAPIWLSNLCSGASASTAVPRWVSLLISRNSFFAPLSPSLLTPPCPRVGRDQHDCTEAAA